MGPWKWGHGELKDFGQELARGRLLRRAGRGLCVVPVDRIVGSAGKAASMDRRFRYKSGKVDQRLRRLRELNAYAMVALPPVELYAINDEYYVVDGHHRVALALENDQPEIDAYVTAHEVEYPATTVAAAAGRPTFFRRWRTALAARP